MLMYAGVINEDRLRELLTTMGDRFTEDEVLITATVSVIQNSS